MFFLLQGKLKLWGRTTTPRSRTDFAYQLLSNYWIFWFTFLSLFKSLVPAYQSSGYLMFSKHDWEKFKTTPGERNIRDCLKKAEVWSETKSETQSTNELRDKGLTNHISRLSITINFCGKMNVCKYCNYPKNKYIIKIILNLEILFGNETPVYWYILRLQSNYKGIEGSCNTMFSVFIIFNISKLKNWGRLVKWTD